MNNRLFKIWFIIRTTVEAKVLLTIASVPHAFHCQILEHVSLISGKRKEKIRGSSKQHPHVLNPTFPKNINQRHCISVQRKTWNFHCPPMCKSFQGSGEGPWSPASTISHQPGPMESSVSSSTDSTYPSPQKNKHSGLHFVQFRITFCCKTVSLLK